MTKIQQDFWQLFYSLDAILFLNENPLTHLTLPSPTRFPFKMAAVFLSCFRFSRCLLIYNSSIIRRKAIILLRLTSARAVAWKPLGSLSKRNAQWRLFVGVGGGCLSAGVALCYSTSKLVLEIH